MLRVAMYPLMANCWKFGAERAAARHEQVEITGMSTPAEDGCISTAGLSSVGIVCDLLTEQWPSMNLVADELFKDLQERHAGRFRVQQLRPPWESHHVQSGTALNGAPPIGKRVFNRIVRYPLWLSKKRNDFDLFHVIDHSYAHLVHRLPPERTVVTCHDIDAFRCLLEPADTFPRHVWRGVTRHILSGLQTAAWIICDSGATADDLLANGWVLPERMSVIPLGAAPVFSPRADPPADHEADHLLAGHPGVKLLHVGSSIPRKRLDVLLRAFAGIKQAAPDAKLVRVGGPLSAALQSLAQQLEIDRGIITLPFVSDRVLAAVYRRCNLLIHPSDGEGFGLPLLEAMACGLPVVCSDIPALKEVGGDAASYVAAGDVEAFVSATLRLIREQPAEIERRRRNGLIQAGKFSWSKCADETVKIYEKVLAATPIKVRDSVVKIR